MTVCVLNTAFDLKTLKSLNEHVSFLERQRYKHNSWAMWVQKFKLSIPTCSLYCKLLLKHVPPANLEKRTRRVLGATASFETVTLNANVKCLNAPFNYKFSSHQVMCLVSSGHVCVLISQCCSLVPLRNTRNSYCHYMRVWSIQCINHIVILAFDWLSTIHREKDNGRADNRTSHTKWLCGYTKIS